MGNYQFEHIGIHLLRVRNKRENYIKEKLKCKFFCRYMDDLIILSHDKEYLKNMYNDSWSD